jgi:hypothetical protein
MHQKGRAWHLCGVAQYHIECVLYQRGIYAVLRSTSTRSTFEAVSYCITINSCFEDASTLE